MRKKPQKTEAEPKRQRRSDFKGFKPVLFRLEERQDKALTAEALRRAAEAETARPDKSAVLREILDGWMGRR
ncbi:hypothetical protein A2cp1_2145 [Anaeromyxobacter dehalogenans 2CP-1]|uniref:Ribbon-helix-helix protein CopG domain-containing protein n=1 Tax=Anaeromyxobacter dehalogenans (strain ATCC BAA-258 / DSM 21875 / 2CP-1) TaxID=455488 RepID=B8J979_ANAD2|nr:hypothetical protein [Anaeromyxobacter dehalogenans]ACL65485.1 hypothetical protein A2cp1_2145 [Anaeromyxobacter dehalogenans 2CP-1]